MNYKSLRKNIGKPIRLLTTPTTAACTVFVSRSFMPTTAVLPTMPFAFLIFLSACLFALRPNRYTQIVRHIFGRNAAGQ